MREPSHFSGPQSANESPDQDENSQPVRRCRPLCTRLVLLRLAPGPA